MYSIMLEKEEQIKSKVKGITKIIIKIRPELNETENRQTIEKINKLKLRYLLNDSEILCFQSSFPTEVAIIYKVLFQSLSVFPQMFTITCKKI